MTRKEKIENMLIELPCLFEDYKNGRIKRYSILGGTELSEEELMEAKHITNGSDLICIIEQDAYISGECISLKNYVIDKKGFIPQKTEFINIDRLRSSMKRSGNIEEFKQIAYTFKAYCYNKILNRYDFSPIGIIPYEDTVLRIW